MKVYRLRLNVVTHWDTFALWWCVNTRTENNNAIPWAHPSPQAKRHLDRLRCYWSANCCDRLTDRPWEGLSDQKLLHTRHGRSMRFNGNFLLMFSHTTILLHCGGVWILKPKNRVLEIENWTEWKQNWKIQTDPALVISRKWCKIYVATADY